MAPKKEQKRSGADNDVDMKSPKKAKSDASATASASASAAAPSTPQSVPTNFSMTAVYTKAKEGAAFYGYEKLHAEYQAGKYAGVYGGANAAWHGLAGIRANVDLSLFHKRRSPDEFYLEEIEQHLNNPFTRRRWDDIVSLDPLGMFASPPTMAAVYSSICIPELKFEQDGKIVNPDGSANVMKLAIDYVWNIPRLAKRLKMEEKKMRTELAKYCQNETVLDTNKTIFLPPVGAVTVYSVGDIRKLKDESTEVALRVHDSCCGSDVFGTDICTCRPYLVFAIKGVVECAQRGGVGLIVYFQKEGRSLGEVTKFRVYNARKAQKGGDRPDMYFYQTESIAGIRDARFQEVMPDVFHLLGIQRIDWLLSMSADKYDAIVDEGVQVMQRVPLPDMYVPRNAHIEITAKISAGYHSDEAGNDSAITGLRSLEMVRERCGEVYKLALEGKAVHFKLNLSKLDETAAYVAKEAKANYPDLNIPYHSRWRHFPQPVIDALIKGWPCDDTEKSRRMIDLVTISVLLDAGAGKGYHYRGLEDDKKYERSEALAMATLDMFKEGMFSSDPNCVPHRANSHGLKNLRQHDFEKGFQINDKNPMVGSQHRFKLLQRLGESLEKNQEFFGAEICRPGNIVDYVLKNAKDKKCSLRVIWRAVIEGFESVWPENLSGVRRGDVWVYNPLKRTGKAASDMIPFHKLSQWLTYSLLEPIERLGITVTDMHLLTGLAEYRNGGLLVDTGVLVPINPQYNKLQWDIGSELVVEWRAITVALLDELAARVRKVLGKSDAQLNLAKVLQGGTWSAGRVIAKSKREDGSAPITVRSDGTVF